MLFDFCSVKNNELIITIKENNRKINYNINDYISNIKKDGFYGGFIEIYAIM